MREWVPAKGDQVEYKLLWREPCYLGSRREGVERVVDRPTEELRHTAPVPECLALNQADKIVLASNEVEECADVRLDGFLRRPAPVTFRVGAGHRLLSTVNDSSKDSLVERLFAAEEVGRRAPCD